MNSKKLTIAAALLMGFSTVTFADSKNEAKDTKSLTEVPAEAKTSTAEVKWFHFNGTPSQVGDASKYSEEAAPACSSTSLPQRCDILIMSQGTTPDRPDLSQTVQDETKRAE